MPAGIFRVPGLPGVPFLPSWGNDDTFWQARPTFNGQEVPIGKAFVIPGPHPASTAEISTSAYNPGQAKASHVRLYRNGALVSDDSFAVPVEGTDGIYRWTFVSLPAWGRTATYQWTYACVTIGTPILSSAHRAIRIPWPVNNLDGRVPPALGPVFGLPAPQTTVKWTLPLTSATGHYPLWYRTAAGQFALISPPSAGRVVGLRRPVPASGPFSVIGRMSHAGGGTDNRSGIFVAIPGGKANVCGPFQQDGGFGAIGVTTASYTADWSGYDGYYTSIGGTISVLNLFKIAWNGAGTLAFSVSTNNGATWSSIGSRTGMARPDSCGICQYSNSSALGTGPTLTVDNFWVASGT